MKGVPAAKLLFVVTMLMVRYRSAVCPGAMGLDSMLLANVNWMLLGTLTFCALALMLIGADPSFLTTSWVVTGRGLTESNGP